jgi:hypothetical protein
MTPSTKARPAVPSDQLVAVLRRTVEALDRARDHDDTDARAASEAAHALLATFDQLASLRRWMP